MQNQKSSIVFDQDRAAVYDERATKWSPMLDAFPLLMRLVLAELPTNARILCVGLGTGSELINLAQAFPHWRFTAVEPAAAMLDICRQRAAACGITSRCTFHEGYLDSLPETDAFDAATCLLVSHFFVQPEEQRQFFQQIAARLRPNGYLVSSALAFDRSTSAYHSLLEVWARAQIYAEVPREEAEKSRTAWERDVGILPPQEVASIIASSGFDTPVSFFQMLFIHAWYAKRTD